MEEIRPNISPEEEIKKLKYYCQQLIEQNRELAQATNLINKLPWLFKVLDTKDHFDDEFVSRCAGEIKDILTPVDNESENKE